MSWRTVLRWAAFVGVAESVIVVGVVEKSINPPVLIIAILLLVGAILLGRTGPGGVRLTTVAFVLFLLSNLVFAAPDLAVAASFGSFAVSWASVVTALVGVIAGVASWRAGSTSVAAAAVGIGGIGLAAVAVVIGLVASLSFTNAKPAAGDILLRAKDSKFDRTTLASPSGQVSFFLDNADNALHNLHILGVKSGSNDMPANHKTRFTVALTAGTYKYRCDYHTDMKGTLKVS
jgi:plastocyanin